MYPLNAILIGCADSVLSELRQEFANLSVTVESEHLNVRECLTYVLANPGPKRLFVVNPKSTAEISHLERLNESVVGQPILALVDPVNDPSMMMRAMRGGAAQVVRLPLQSPDFQSAMQRIAIQFGFPASQCRSITVMGASEGSGRTTIALNVASEIGRLRKAPCILAEGSISFSRLAHYLAIDPKETLYDLMSDSDRVDTERIRRALTKVNDHLQVLTGSHRKIKPLPFTSGQARKLLAITKPLADTIVVNGRYNYEALDFEFISKMDQIVFVAKPTVTSLASLKMTLDEVTSFDCLAEQFIVINQFDPKDKDFTLPRIQDVLRAQKLFTVVADPGSCRLAENAGQTFDVVAPHSRICSDIRKLACAIVGETEEESHSGWTFMDTLSRVAHAFSAK